MLQLLKKGTNKDKKGKRKEKEKKGASKSKDDLLSTLPSVPSGLPSGSDVSNKSQIQRKVPEKSVLEQKKIVDGVKDDDGLDPKKMEGSKETLKHAGAPQNSVSKEPGESKKDENKSRDLKESRSSVEKFDAMKTDDRKEIKQNQSTSSKVNKASGQAEAKKESSNKKPESQKVPQSEKIQVLKLSNLTGEDSNLNIQASKLNMADSEESNLSIESKEMENSKESVKVVEDSKKFNTKQDEGESKKADKKSDKPPGSSIELNKSDAVTDAKQLKISSSDFITQDLKSKSTSENLMNQSSSSSSPRLPAEKKTQEGTKKRDGVISGQIDRSDSKKRAKIEPSPASKINGKVKKDQQQQPEIKAKHPVEASASRNPKKNSKDDDNNLVSQTLEATASIPEYDANTPVGWEKRTSRSTGKPYYLNMYTKESQWDVPAGPADPPAVPMETIICRHILIKHKDSRWPYSWRKDSDSIQRTRQEALEALESYRKDILSGELYFADVASAYSDCSSAAVGGDLGKFTRGVMLEAFENVAFGLEVKQVSEIVETECGYHLIMRLA